ncbi:MAG: hypothetical protein RL748_871, partial [Pseudomonadota bacterium]
GGAYTSDSNIPKALVHSGLLQPGQSARVKITVLGALPYFTGTTANGLTTASYPASWCGMQLALDAPPTISASHSPNPLVAGQAFTMNWRSTNASTISYTCSNGGGLVLSGSSPNATGTVNASALAGWVSDAPVCSWTATGSGGASANYRDSLSTVTPPPTAPVINSVIRSPATMTAGSPFTVSWNTSNASNMAYACTPSSGSSGYNGSGSGLVASGSISGTAAAAWAGTSSTCVWTATGAGGTTATYRETVATNAAAAEEVVTYIHTDALGSPVAKSDANGNLIGSRTRYEPYGATSSGATPTIGFTGHVSDANTGLIYMQQRYYDPVAGRFLSTDPVLTDANTGASFNRYVYANNSPYRYVDPDGRFGTQACKDMAGNCHTYAPDGTDSGHHEYGKTLNESQARPYIAAMGEALEKSLDIYAEGVKQYLIIESGGFLGRIGLRLLGSAGAAAGTTGHLGLTKASDIGEKIIKWGEGQAIKDVMTTIERTKAINKQEVSQMIKQGLERQWVEKQLTAYRAAIESSKKSINAQLYPRIELMKKILSNWPE